MTTAGPTEATYKRWIDMQGRPDNVYQEKKIVDILRLARALDETSVFMGERRARLMKRIQVASKDLRASLADSKVSAVTDNE